MTKEKNIVSIRKILGQNREDQSNLGTFSMAMKNAFSFYTSSELSFVHLHFVWQGTQLMLAYNRKLFWDFSFAVIHF